MTDDALPALLPAPGHLPVPAAVAAAGDRAALRLEWALGAGQVQAADLTGGRACCSSNCTGLR